MATASIAANTLKCLLFQKDSDEPLLTITECAEKCKPLQLKGMAPSAVTPRAEMTRAQTHCAETPNAESGPARQDSRTD